jgi:hypothetical protein
LLQPYPAEKMVCYWVIPLVNNPGNHGPGLIIEAHFISV